MARRWMEQSMTDLRQALSPMLPMTAMDGGRIAPQMGTELPQEKWREVTKLFFRN
jgi:hypothetical protein